MPGPLSGIKVLEMEAIGPAPFAGMVRADMGADVLMIERPQAADLGLKRSRRHDVMLRGKRSATLDLKTPAAKEAALQLAARADVLIEGFRPGVMERLGLGPEDVFQVNKKIVYGRMTGWGQTGPMAPRAGHDINYIALAGVLHAIGRKGEAPVPPLNLVGDFGGGGMLLAFGVAAALVEAARSGKGQVVDAAMVEGASLLAAMFAGLMKDGQWSEMRGENILDTGAPWYNVYETKDGKFVSIGSIEARFFEDLLARLGLKDVPPQHDRSRWPQMKAAFEKAFRTRTRDEWCRIFEGSDACFAPVLSFSEAQADPHNRARGSFVSLGGVAQPAPAPRFSRTPAVARAAPPERGQDGGAALHDWGFSKSEIQALRERGLEYKE